MENVDILILELLSERKDSLSYYQLSRKLKNRNLHVVVLNLGEIIEKLLHQELISMDKTKISDVHFYEITTKGIESLLSREKNS